MTRSVESALQRQLPASVWTALLVLCTIAAAAALRRIFALLIPSAPPHAETAARQGMAVLDQAFAGRSALTLSHIIPALIFILLLPFWFMQTARANPLLYRRLSYLLLALGAVIGVTALLLIQHPFGGVNEASAAVLYDLLFLFCLLRAWLLLRRNDLALYRTWMLRGIAVLLGIATTRPIMAVFFSTERITHLQPQQFFGTAFWLGFTITYIAGEAWLRSHSASGFILAE
jgi:hypothetical protein